MTTEQITEIIDIDEFVARFVPKHERTLFESLQKIKTYNQREFPSVFDKEALEEEE